MEPWPPLAGVDVALGPPFALLHLLRIDLQDLAAVALQQLNQGEPIDHRRFQGEGVMRPPTNQSANASQATV